MLLGYPLRNPTIIQSFGFDNTNDPERKAFYTLFDNKHCGIDFEANIGTPVFCAYDGIMVRKEFHHKGMGKVIGIRNGNIVMLYAHLSHIQVNLGDIIRQGEIIGLSGNTGGATTGPHLHFEMRDITKPSLKEMVFDPHFDFEIQQFKDIFSYTVSNTNTKKSFGSLSRAYFGTQRYWKVIQDANPELKKYHKNDILGHGIDVIIPNFSR